MLEEMHGHGMCTFIYSIISLMANSYSWLVISFALPYYWVLIYHSLTSRDSQDQIFEINTKLTRLHANNVNSLIHLLKLCG